MQVVLNSLKRIGSDIAVGRHLDAYVISAIGIILIALGIIGDVSQNLQLTVIIAALTLLVFRTTSPQEITVDLDAIMQDRGSFGAFRDMIRGADTLWLYGPSVGDVLSSNYASIREEILNKGGRVHVILQDTKCAAGIENLRNVIDQTQSSLLEKILTILCRFLIT